MGLMAGVLEEDITEEDQQLHMMMIILELDQEDQLITMEVLMEAADPEEEELLEYPCTQARNIPQS
jgi:hypothetical protein